MRRAAVKDGALGQALLPSLAAHHCYLRYPSPYTCQIHMQGHERRKHKGPGGGGGLQSLGTPNDDQTAWERRSLVFVRGKWMMPWQGACGATNQVPGQLNSPPANPSQPKDWCGCRRGRREGVRTTEPEALASRPARPGPGLALPVRNDGQQAWEVPGCPRRESRQDAWQRLSRRRGGIPHGWPLLLDGCSASKQ